MINICGPIDGWGPVWESVLVQVHFRCVSAGRCGHCVTTLEQVQSSLSVEEKNSWCWEEWTRTGFAVVRETRRDWCRLATRPSSCDCGTMMHSIVKKKQIQSVYFKQLLTCTGETPPSSPAPLLSSEREISHLPA